MTEQWVKIGMVGKAHGLYGAFFVANRQEPLPSKLSRLKVTGHRGCGQVLTVIKVKQHNKRSVIQCQELSQREQVDSIKGLTLSCLKAEVPISHQDEYFWQDLIDRKVVDSEGVSVGKVTHLANFGASDIIELTNADGKVLALPFVELYFDMKFAPHSSKLSLKVPAQTFTESWQDP